MKTVGMAALALFWCVALSAQHIVTGRVVTESGDPLLGATILLVSEKVGTTCDGDGRFSLPPLKAGGYSVEVSFLGFQKKVINFSLEGDQYIDIILEEEILKTDEVIVYATRAQENTPTTFTSVSKAELNDRNLGQDLPILLNQTPSMVTTSDAGAGIGYTGMRIRGSDATRINVTMNGVPLNDAESHGVYWVNMPDFSSSVSSIQIQRGVGTSSNGSSAFGASVNVQTNGPSEAPEVGINTSAGSFGTLKTNFSFKSGYLNEHFNFEGRVSRITSDGYIDRSASDLNSYFLTGGYYGSKTLLKFVVFGGREKTQQAWYGTPEARLNNDPSGIQAVIDNSGEYNTAEQIDNLKNSGRAFNYYLYNNEIDHYGQNHYQLHLSHSLNTSLEFTGALHYTHGRGYYEQYRTQDDFSAYGLPDVTIGDSTVTSSDFIRRRWLKNDFYGGIYALTYKATGLQITLGGAANTYNGDHFGEIIWAQYASSSQIRDHYYDGAAKKTDVSGYIKANWQPIHRINTYGDLQVRKISYHTSGIDNDLTAYTSGGNYLFFNPKVGMTYALSAKTQAYSSLAVGNREPVRTDFIDAPNGNTPKSENMKNLEVGIRNHSAPVSFEANYYLMAYKNQLVLTGTVNDVGSPIRTNVTKSYRSGVELSGSAQILDWLKWSMNATLSQNRILNFKEVTYDYGPTAPSYETELAFKKTPISFSPDLIMGSTFQFDFVGFKAHIFSKYVGDQYLDNTGNDDRKIDAYLTNDLLVSYSLKPSFIKELVLSLLVNNLTNLKYASNGYTWGYLYDGFRYQQNNYYPQAGINFLAGLSIKF